MFRKTKENFNPLMFLSSLGFGGLAVTAFMFIQYGGIYTGKGLAVVAGVTQTPLVMFLEAAMLGLAVLHLALTFQFFVSFFAWRKTESYKVFKNNPLINSALMAPIVSLAMSFNIVIAVARYFVPFLSGNFQAIMAPAFVPYVLLWLWAISTAIILLKKAFVQSFDVDKIHFGWLLQPFALAMVTVTGTGFAALAKNTESIAYNSDIAAVAAFLSVISGSMALFLFLVKIFSIFKKHLHRDTALENTFVPTYLIVIPIITLFGISIFRLGHYTDHLYDAPILFTISKLILFALFAFEVWYFAFGLVMLKGYWKGYLSGNFHVSQWGLVCPFVAFVALGLFFSKAFLVGSIFIGAFFYFLLAIFVFTMVLLLFLLKRQTDCIKGRVSKKYLCVK